MFAIGNNDIEELEYAGETALCPHCTEPHKIEYGTDAKTGDVSKLLGFVKCSSDKVYLVAVDGKLLKKYDLPRMHKTPHR